MTNEMDDSIGTATSDPTKWKSRVFVGNAPTFGATKADYKSLFDPFGNVLAVSIHKGFVFIQFEREEAALEAIRQKHGTMYKDYKLEVSIAKGAGDRKKPDASRQDNTAGNRRRSPAPDNRRGRTDRDRERDRDRDRTGSRDRGFDAGRGDRRRNSHDRSPNRGRSTVDRLGRDNRLRDELTRISSFRVTGKSRFDEPATDRLLDLKDDRRSMNVDNYRETAMDLSPGPVMSTDCEIVIPHHTQRTYGELVESRLKNLGINCDILFPHDPSQLPQVLDDIARRGCRYAVVLLPQNEQHKSATVHILWGVTPEEHRNMPLDKAMNLIACNYESYLTSVREKTEAKAELEAIVSPLIQPMVPMVQPIVQPMSQPIMPIRGADPALSVKALPDPDDGVQDLFKILADGRALSVPQIDAVVRHLLQRRMQILSDEQAAAAAAASVPAGSGFNQEPVAATGTMEKDIAEQQAEIQKRILNILTALAAPALNLSTTASTPAEVPLANNNSTWGTSSAAASMMMGYDDSSVNKQIDTLNQKAMLLRSLQGGASGMPGSQSLGPAAVASQQMLGMAQQQSAMNSHRMPGNSHGYMGNMMGQSRY